MRAADGTITTFDVPAVPLDLVVAGINASGVVAGSYSTSAEVAHAFVRAVDGTITIADPPAALATQATGINDQGLITGVFATGQGPVHGFVRTP